MKVCLCLECMDVNGGGPSRSVPALAKSLSNEGVNVTILTRYSETNNIHILEGTGVSIVEINNNNEIYDVLNNEFDIIHTQGLWRPFYHYITKISKKLKVPLLITPRGTLEPYCLETKKIKKRFAMALYQRQDLNEADCLLATARAEADNFRKLGLKSPIAIIPNGIELSNYPLRKNIIPKKQVLFLSRLSPKKGIPILIKAWKELVESFDDWSLLIVGNGTDKYRQELIMLIKDLGLESSIHILPPAFGDIKYKLYSESSLFVLPTYSENFGMAIAEAMAVGLPVITTKGTPWEVISTMGAGWWIDLSISSLKNSLKEAMSLNPDLLINKGKVGHEIIKNNYTNNVVALKMIELYEWLCSNRKCHPNFVEF